jgi:hypothetical protein
MARRSPPSARQILRSIHPPTPKQLLLRSLPHSTRRILRDLRHPPTLELLLKRYLRKLTKAAKRDLKREFKKLLRQRPRPRSPVPETTPETLALKPTPVLPGEDRFIEVQGYPVRVIGLPKLPPPILYSSGSRVGEKPPGLLREAEAAILEEIGEIVDSEGLIAEDLFDED